MFLPDTLPAIFPLADAIRDKVLPLSYRRWYEIARTPGFPAFSVGRKIMISRNGLEIWIADQIKANGRIA
jgi:hypothetical protein